MRLVSINVGLEREIEWRGDTVRTSIFKSPVAGQVRVTKLNLEGDQQTDLSVHGGIARAIYAYSSEHYAYWREELPGTDFPWGAFGENFTTEGLLDDSVHIGDRLRVGTTELMVSQPRMPCFKLGIRFSRPDMVKRFHVSGGNGFYLAVLQEGEVTAGDRFTWSARDESGVTVAEVVRLYTTDDADQDLLQRVIELPALTEGWREHFRKRLLKLYP